jgi:RNA polymerase sigma-70 factor (ECF subfamily)
MKAAAEAAAKDSISAPSAVAAAEPDDAVLIAAVRGGDIASFESLVVRYQPRIFGVVRRYVRRETEAQDVVQDIFIKVFQKLDGFRADAPFEHWLMRLAVRTCYDYLRQQQRNREHNVTDLKDASDSADILERSAPATKDEDRVSAARELVYVVLAQLSPAARMVITMLEIEERTVKEISNQTGWSETLVKVRAFRARAEMKKILARIPVGKYL